MWQVYFVIIFFFTCSSHRMRFTEDLSSTGQSKMSNRHMRALSAVSAYGASVALHRPTHRPTSAKMACTQGNHFVFCHSLLLLLLSSLLLLLMMMMLAISVFLLPVGSDRRSHAARPVSAAVTRQKMTGGELNEKNGQNRRE